MNLFPIGPIYLTQSVDNKISESERFEMFHAVTDALGVVKAHCVFVDDRKPNVEKAQQCGMVGIHFTGAKALDISLKKLGL